MRRMLGAVARGLWAVVMTVAWAVATLLALVLMVAGVLTLAWAILVGAFVLDGPEWLAVGAVTGTVGVCLVLASVAHCRRSAGLGLLMAVAVGAHVVPQVPLGPGTGRPERVAVAILGVVGGAVPALGMAVVRSGRRRRADAAQGDVAEAATAD